VQLWLLGYHASWREPGGGSTFHCRIQGDAAGPKFVVSLEVGWLGQEVGGGVGGGGWSALGALTSKLGFAMSWRL
jgi:hypothetical protein